MSENGKWRGNFECALYRNKERTKLLGVFELPHVREEWQQ